MPVFELSVLVPAPGEGAGLFEHFSSAVEFRTANKGRPIRFVISETTADGYHCELGLVNDPEFAALASGASSIFEFRRRAFENQDRFNAVLLIPTGIGCDIGGHAGDATPVARLLAGSCDTLILHPNVVNASDINEAPENALYCEGSVVTRLMMGTLGVRTVRSNRVLVIYDGDHHPLFKKATQNAVNAARATYGLTCAGILEMDEPVRLKAEVSRSGRATGSIENLEHLLHELSARRETFDAVALASVIEVSQETHLEYFTGDGATINPWGGVEALLTHAVTTALDVPSAHSPMMESEEIASADLGVVDPRIGAEAVSLTFLNCVLKGLQRSPQLVTDEALWGHGAVLTAADVSCLVIPDGCLGLPTIAALHQGVPVIAVRENRNLMKNDLDLLPWGPHQFFRVDNYWEACGVMAALRAGIDPHSTRRPITAVEPRVVPAPDVNATQDGEEGDSRQIPASG